MKFNLIEKTVFSLAGIICLFCVVRDYSTSNDIFVTGVYGFMIGLPVVFLVGVYLLIKSVVSGTNSNSNYETKTVRNEPPTLFSQEPAQKCENSKIKKFSKCGYMTFAFVYAGIILFAFAGKLFLLGILFVPLILAVWLAAFVCAIYPIGMWISSLLSAPVKPQAVKNTQFTTEEAWGIIAYFAGLITGVLVLYNFFFNK